MDTEPMFMKYFSSTFHGSPYDCYVYDRNGRLVLEYGCDDPWPVLKELVNVLNGCAPAQAFTASYRGGQCDATIEVAMDGIVHYVTIRGWGYLTAPGGCNLDPNDAALVQDSIGEYIVDSVSGG